MKREDQEFLSGMMDGEWQSLDVSRSIAEVCGDRELREKWSRYHLVRQALQSEPVMPAGSLAERIARAIDVEPVYSNVTAFAGGTTAIAPIEESPAEGSPVEGWPAEDSRAVDGRAGGTTAWRTFAAGFGLAASVAVVTVLGLGAWQGEGGDVSGSGDLLTAGGSAPDAGEVADGAAAGVVAARADVAPADPAIPDLASVPDVTERTAAAFAFRAPDAVLPNVDLVSNTSPAAVSGAYWVAPGSGSRLGGSEARLNMFLSQHIESSPTGERQGMLPYSRLVGYDERTPAGR